MINLRKLSFILCILSICSYAQNTELQSFVKFDLKFNKQPLHFNQNVISSRGDTLSIKVFRCYISNIEIYYADNSVFKQKNSYHLLDSDDPESLMIPVAPTNHKIISKVVFNVGIDSLTSTSGAMTGSLDPVKGMYWAWQSGYINMKLEGKSSSCRTRKNEFQFHIGGYMPPYNALRKITLFNSTRTSQLTIAIDIDRFFSEIDLSTTNSVMIPGKTAMILADNFGETFRLE